MKQYTDEYKGRGSQESTDLIKLSNSDTWFYNSLQCLLGAEKLLVEKGITSNIDRNKIANWVRENS